jgi:hypothetical protein
MVPHIVCTKISAALIARKREAEQKVRQQEDHIKKQVYVCVSAVLMIHLTFWVQHEVEAKFQRQNYARKQSVGVC